MTTVMRIRRNGVATCITLLVTLAATGSIRNTHGFSSKTPSATRKTTSPILTPSNPSDGGVPFDTGCVANPVILPPSTHTPDDEWQCYYYGNSGFWNGGTMKCFLPTGSSGLAISKDGLSGWTKVVGNERDGAVLAPSEDSRSWDRVHTGVGDVIRVNATRANGKVEEELHMYYFGASDEEISMGATGSIAGFRMRIGRAKSTDRGRSWTKDESYLLDYEEGEGFFASWPRIVTFDDHGGNEEGKESKPWKMFYHSFNGSKWRVFGAESSDKGDTWTRTGLVLEGDYDESNDAFDFSGIGTRGVTHWRGGLLMIYEGVAKSGTHRLGAAFCADPHAANGGEWTKLNDGRPILEPGKGALGEWTKQVIGTPFVVSMPDGSLRVYHCGKDGPDGKMSIGVVVSESGGVEPDCWTAHTTVG